MAKEIIISLGGSDKTLIFGKVNFLRYIDELTKESGYDVMKGLSSNTPGDAYKTTVYLVHAGLLCGNHKDLTEAQVREWVDELPVEKVEEIQWEGYSAISGKPVDELKRLVEEAAKKNGVSKLVTG